MAPDELRRLGQRALSAKHAGDTAMMDVWLDFILDAKERDVDTEALDEALDEASREEIVQGKGSGARA